MAYLANDQTTGMCSLNSCFQTRALSSVHRSDYFPSFHTLHISPLAPCFVDRIVRIPLSFGEARI